MTRESMTPTALVLSTTPPLPRDYGNRNRVYQMVEFLKKAGFRISFILYPHDEDWTTSVPPYYRELVDIFDYFTVIPNSIKLHQRAAGFHHEIDEWWDDNIGRHLEWLFHRKHFDVFVVNYTFLSKALDYAPRSTLRILETHDIFSGRRETFERNGVPPEFFYTDQPREKIAFDRADAVLAIKASEQKLIAGQTRARTICIPYWDEGLAAGERKSDANTPIFSHDRPLRLGFIGAENSVNIVNMRRFLSIFNRYVQLYNLPVTVIVAGNVCRQLHENFAFLKKLGRVATIDEFYLSVDAIIAPLEFSTGIKIKVGEALAWKLPVLATENAFDGFKAYHKTQSEASVHELCQSIASLAYNEISFEDLRAATSSAARAAARAQEAGFTELRGWIKASMKRLVVVVDRPIWYRATFIDEMLVQTIEYISHIKHTVVIYTCPQTVNKSAIYASIDYFQASDEPALRALIGEAANGFEIIGINLVNNSVSRTKVGLMFDEVGIKTWELSVDQSLGRSGASFRSRTKAGVGPEIPVTTLRYRPAHSPKRSVARKGLQIFTRPDPSKWEQIALDLVTLIAGEMNMSVAKYEIPNWYEYNTAFMAAALRDPTEHVVLFVGAVDMPFFLLQMWHYSKIDPLIISETFVFPDRMLDGTVLPSLDKAVRDYLSGMSHGRSLAGPDTGWSQMWGELA